MGVVAAPTAKRGALHTAIPTTITAMHIWDSLTRVGAEGLHSAQSLSTLTVPAYICKGFIIIIIIIIIMVGERK
jgi:hypothetical protein